jgi:hypothetical protein
MARKETPDVLGEVLAGVGEAPAVSVAPAPPTGSRKPRGARTLKGKAAKPEPPLAAAPHGWDYLVVSFSDYRGWRPRFINGQEVRNWMHAPLIHDYLAQLGEDGWEMAGAGGGKALYGASDYYQAFFKRPKR